MSAQLDALHRVLFMLPSSSRVKSPKSEEARGIEQGGIMPGTERLKYEAGAEMGE